ncbi:PREDICTED: uncharacterized protein LOC109116099 [Tarenaya hassleriana]|uniref:uncharacterized protein LOC109116099 n=1 Tax=Tarenaya hassleriana TaxID=28532 RepID=UPI0008FCFA66|nr:PREDICTED: uncharacterized protein LOC109116099 [Tarenaya hassleriana]
MEYVNGKPTSPDQLEKNFDEDQVTKQLHLKSSTKETQMETLNKKAVLKRIRNHKCLHQIKSFLLSTATAPDSEQRWLDRGDVFSCP